MKVGIDLHAVNRFMQGSNTYIYQLARCLTGDFFDLAYVLYCNNQNVIEALQREFSGNVQFQLIPHSRMQRLVTKFPDQCNRSQLDLLHVQYIAPFRLRMPYVISLHDVLHETLPQYFPTKIRRLMSVLYPLSARRARMVFALSQYTRDQVVSLYRVKEDNISVVYPGVSEEFCVIEDQDKLAAVRKKYDLPDEYMLYVGRIEPRKNITAIVEACNTLEHAGRMPCEMVIAGMADPMMPEYYREVVARAEGARIRFAGRVEQEDLPLVYNGASLFVYPSHGEGFGLPVIEAMACGVPVIASNVTSLPEAVGNAGMMVDPLDTAALAAAIERIMSSSALRHELRALGLVHAQQFTWKKTAATVHALYQKILG